MRVLFIAQYYPPETGGPQNRMASLAEGFLARGHDVHVITEKPNYPTGIVWPEYRGGLFKHETINGVNVTQCAIWEDKSKSFTTRIRFYLSFVFTSILASMRVKGKFDVVITSSPPLFVGISGYVASKLKRAKYVFDVRDLWPDVAVAMGELTNSRAASIAKRLEKFIYRHADGITAVTDSFCDDIRKTAGESKRVVRVTNGTVPEIFDIQEEQKDLRTEFGMSEAKYVGFIGNMGLAQGLEHVVEAARLLAETGVTFLFVGEGARKQTLQEMAAEQGVKNIDFRSRVDLATAARYMSACDALLVSLGDNKIYEKFIPSKLFDSMAAAKPVLLNVDGESRTIMDAAKAGLYYPPQDAAALADAIGELFAGHLDRTEMGRRGRDYVSQNFSRQSQAQVMCEFVESLVTPGSQVPLPDHHLNEIAA